MAMLGCGLVNYRIGLVRLGGWGVSQQQLGGVFFLSFFLLPVLRLFATLRVMTDSKCLSLHTRSSLANSPYFSPFSRFLAVVLALPPTFGLPLLSLVKQVFTC